MNAAGIEKYLGRRTIRNLKKLICYVRKAVLISVICALLIPGSMLPECEAEAGVQYSGLKITGPDGTQTFYSSDGSNEIISVSLSDPEYCVFTGKHVDSTASLKVGESHIVYGTMGFTFNRELPAVKGEVTSVRYVTLGHSEYTQGSKEPGDGYMYTTYTFTWDKLYEILDRLGYTVEQLSSESGVTLYMSNIFRTRLSVKRSNGLEYTDRKTNIMNLSEMLRAEAWGDRTRNILPYYYSIPITVQKVYFRLDKIRTNCPECALLNVLAIEKGKGKYRYCPEHSADHKDIWFKLDTLDVTDEFPVVRRTGIAVRVLKPSIKYDGKIWYLNADVSGTTVRACRTYFAYYDEKDGDSRGIVGSEYAFVSPASDSAVYSLSLKDNGNFAVRVRRSKPYDSVLIVPYTDKKEKPESETPKTDEISSEGLALSRFKTGASSCFYSDYFDVNAAIPTTEIINGRVKAAEYLFEADFETVKGTKQYSIAVEQPYSITCRGPAEYATGPDGELLTDADGHYIEIPGEPVVYEGSVSGVVTVSRDFSYTVLKSFSCYTIDSALLSCGVLDEDMRFKPKCSAPDVSFRVYDAGEHGHMEEPAGIHDTLVMPLFTGSDPDSFYPTFPTVGAEAAAAAEKKIGQIKVHNDSLIFNGKALLDDRTGEKTAPEPNPGAVPEAKQETMEITGELIAAYKANGSYPASGSITYRQCASYRGSRPAVLQEALHPEAVFVHTPVACSGSLINDNSKYIQLLAPDRGCVPLVTGDSTESEPGGYRNASCDFNISISNYGTHISKKGYGTRNYASNYSGLAGGYIAGSGYGTNRNEVRFPFDVYIDSGNDNRTDNDVLLPAGTWYCTGNSSVHAYLPMWVSDGIYTVDFRTTAVNAPASPDMLSSLQGANTSPEIYVASDSVRVQVSGKLYGFSLDGVEDDPEWRNVFRNGFSFRTGTKTEIGVLNGLDEKRTLPTLAGSNPRHTNRGVLKTGYTVRFSLMTTGSTFMEDGAGVHIVPTFWHVREDGSGRQKVDLYYSEYTSAKNQRLIRIGGGEDSDVRYFSPELTVKVTKDPADRVLRQKLAFEYRLPGTVRATAAGNNVTGLAGAKGTDYSEEMWLKGGYIIVSFDITGYDSCGRSFSSYANTANSTSYGNCCMWKMEGQPSSRTDFYGNTFSVNRGDVFFFFNEYGSANDKKINRIY